MITFRQAIATELDALKAFLFEQGTSPFNYLPQDGLNQTFKLVAQDQAQALVACMGKTITGLAIFLLPSALPQNLKVYAKSAAAIYVAEVVVHRDYVGRGIGSRLLSQVVLRAQSLKVSLLIIDRHEENAASAKMMHRVGFTELCTFTDLDRRICGSRKTTVLTIDVNHDQAGIPL